LSKFESLGAAEERFEDLVDELVGCAGVTPPRGGSGFGRSALRWEKKIFAMLVRGRLVVKLPATRVDALVSGGDGVRFDANKGTTTVLLQRFWRVPDPGRSGVEHGCLSGPPDLAHNHGFAADASL